MSEELKQLYSSLEFDRILEIVSGYAACRLGKQRVLALEPIADRDRLSLRLREVAEMTAAVRYDDAFPIHGYRDVRSSLKKASHEGSMLPIEELIEISQTLEVSGAVHRYLGSRAKKYPALHRYFHTIHSFASVVREIARVIDFSSNEVKDNASPELRSLRRQLRQEQERVRTRLAQLVEQYKDFLQEPIITIRDGRMVIPVREDSKGRVPGFIHDRSSSGATLLIEPMPVFELNNRIRELQIEERREVERLLRQLTELVRERVQDIQESLQTLAELDALHAIGRFAAEWDAAVPRLSDRVLQLIQGYHPLLVIKHGGRERVVPLDVTLGEDFTLLVITGPNAGGKTVALKNIGLSALMVQCGLPILASEESRIPVFDRIFVDIGDQQSVEQDLSTFSAHVARLAEILNSATKNSLVLIDEIGTGTDPAEGAALAMAFLERIREIGALTVVTTHQGALKAFAHRLKGAENASMAFDEESLQPTYRFRVGIPGSSYAFEIATRLGLPQRILRRARELVGSAHHRLEEFILELEQKLNRYQRLLADAEIKKSELEALTKLYRERYQALQKEEKRLKRKAAEESKAILERANAVIEEAVREIRARQAQKDSIKEARARVEAVRNEVEEQLEEFREEDLATGELPKKGDLAFWAEMNVTGEVVTDPDEKGQVWLEVGDLKLQIPLEKLRKAASGAKRPKAAPAKHVETPRDLRTEIDLRGLTMDEARPVLEKYLDQAYLAGLDQVRIIHGKGTGALRKKVQEYLRSHPKVAEFHFAPWNEGDTGVTIVKFR
ncbi:MAG TPA: endonuclease MutS2 [Bacteroidetes bacterium]|nr:endonuclease MutS2 [Bacteroidota bacterium]